MLGTQRKLRDRSSSRDPEVMPPREMANGVKDRVKEKPKTKAFEEPALNVKASFKENGTGSNYGVSEYMQPLGELPSARVKARVKADGARKGMIGRNGIGVDSDMDSTPQPPSHAQRDVLAVPEIKIEDERDGDYAPKATERKKTRPRAVKRESDAPPLGRPGSSKLQQRLPPPNPPKKYEGEKLHNIVEASKRRALDMVSFYSRIVHLQYYHPLPATVVSQSNITFTPSLTYTQGKPDLAAAVNEIYENSLTDERLADLLEATLTQTANEEQTREFQEYVRAGERSFLSTK